MDNVASDTIWNREILKGFIDLLNEKFAGKFSKFKVIVRKPDEDFKLETYPCAVLQITNSRFSVDRYYKKESYVVSKDKENYRGIVDKPPLTYDINLQLDFYANKENDLDTLEITWLSYFRQDFNLQVKTRGGNDDDVHVMPDAGVSKRLDEMNGKDRLFRRCFNYKVYGRIEEHDRRDIPLVKVVKVKTKKLN